MLTRDTGAVGERPDLLCLDCGHHLHRPQPGSCQWRDCSCGAAGEQACEDCGVVLQVAQGLHDAGIGCAVRCRPFSDGGGQYVECYGPAAHQWQAKELRARLSGESEISPNEESDGTAFSGESE